MSSSTLPVDGGGALPRGQSAETRVDPSLCSGILGPTADCPRNREAESISFEGWPSINGFRQWRMSCRRIIASSSTKPTVALAWASEVDEAKEVDQLRSSVYQGDGHRANFETLDTKVAAGLMKIMHGDFKKKVTMRDEQYQVIHKQMLTGRQIAFLLFQHFQINDMESPMLETADLLAVELTCDDLRAFDAEWDNTILGMKEVPDEKYLENLYRKQVKKSKQFETFSFNWSLITFIKADLVPILPSSPWCVNT